MIEKAPDVRFDDVTHFLPLYRVPKLIQSLMTRAPKPISVRTIQKISLINLFQHPRHRLLNQLVLKTWYA
jgi:hypothetical protein